MKIELPHKFFRPGTFVEPQIVGFVVAQGGLGDCIGLSTAIVYIAKHYKNVIGHVFTHDFFIPIMQNFLQNYPEWKVFDVKKDLTQEFLNKHPIKYPTHDPIGRLGAHAVDLGFIYYLNQLTPKKPEYAFHPYPLLDLEKNAPISYEIRIPSARYVVLTPIATNKQKEMISECFNKIVNYLIDNDIQPFFVGKGIPNAEYDLSKGENFLNKTSLFEAALLMRHAKCVLGIDNGLLHLAATYHLCKIIWGFTVSDPIHTKPPHVSRKNIISIYPDNRTLPCRFCQSNMRFFTDKNNIHNFNDGCFYKEEIPACVSEKHLGDPGRWIKGINHFLK